jgi:hypothetical protein
VAEYSNFTSGKEVLMACPAAKEAVIELLLEVQKPTANDGLTFSS